MDPPEQPIMINGPRVARMDHWMVANVTGLITQCIGCWSVIYGLEGVEKARPEVNQNPGTVRHAVGG